MRLGYDEDLRRPVKLIHPYPDRNLVNSRSFLFLILFLLSTSIHARSFTWDEALQTAREHHPGLQATEMALQASQEQVLSAKSRFSPQISSTASYTQTSSGTSSVGNLGVIPSGATVSFSALVSQNLFNGLSDLAKIRQAEANVEVARANLKVLQAQVNYNLRLAFSNLKFAKKALLLSQQIIGRREAHLRLVELRFKAGHENKGSLLLYEAYLQDAKYGETQNHHLVLTAKSQLAQAMGVDESELLDASGEIPTHDPANPPFETPQLDQLAAKSPTYLQTFYQEQVAHARVTLARSAFFPTLEATGSFGRAGPWFPHTDRWTLGLNLMIPLFNGGRDLFEARAALANQSAAELNSKNILRQVQTSLQQNYRAYLESIQKLEVDRSYLKAAATRAQIARANYKNGLVSFQEWDLAENDLITREKNTLLAEQNRVHTEAAYLQTLGEGVL